MRYPRRSPTSRTGINQAGTRLAQGNLAQSDELSAARDAAVGAVSAAQSNGSADPLGAFTETDRRTPTWTGCWRRRRGTGGHRQAPEVTGRSVSDYVDRALFPARSAQASIEHGRPTRRRRRHAAGPNNDVQNAQRAYLNRIRRRVGGSSNMGAVIGGIILGNILSGGMGGGGFGRGGWSSTTYGGVAGSSGGGGMLGGGGRF